MDQATLRIGAEVSQALRAIDSLRSSYLNFAAQYAGATREMAAVVNNVFGDRSIRQALQYSQAVTAIGGATKLTAKEKQNLNGVLTEALEKYRVLGRQAPQELQNLWRETQAGTVKTEGFFNTLFARITGGAFAANMLANAFIKAFDLIKQGAEAAFMWVVQLVDRGSNIKNLTTAFEGLAAGVGLYSGQVLDIARTKTQGLISDFDLVAASNRALLFGLKLNVEDMGKLGEAAIRLGRAMNLGPSKALDDLILALGRVSPRILDNLGIIVKVGEANAVWAAAHKKTIEQMSGSERVLAFQQAAMKEINEHLENAGPLTMTLADRWQQLVVGVVNFNDRIAVSIAKSPVMIMLFDRVSEALRAAFGPEQAKLIGFVTNLIEWLAIKTVNLAKVGVDFALQFRRDWNALKIPVQLLIVGIDEIVSAVYRANLAIAELASRMPGVGNKFKGVTDKLREQSAWWEDRTQKAKESLYAMDAAARGEDAVGVAMKNTSAFLDKLGKDMEAVRGKRIGDIELTDKVVEAEKKLQTQMLQTAIAIEAARAKGATNAQIVAQFSETVEELTGRAEKMRMIVPPALKQVADMTLLMGENSAKVEKMTAALSKKIFELDVKLQGAARTNQSMAEILDAHGSAVERLTLEAEEMGISVPASFKKVTAAAEKMELGKIIAKGYASGRAEFDRIIKDQYTTFTKALAERTFAYGENAKQIVANYRDTAKLTGQIEENGIQEKLILIKIEGDKRREQLNRNGENYQQAMDQIVDWEAAAAQKATMEWEQHIWEVNQKVPSLANGFRQVMQDIPNIIVQGFTGGGGITGALKGAGSAIGSTLMGNLFSGTAVGGNIAKGVQKLFGTEFAATIGGMLGPLGSMIGSLIGPLIGKIAGWFSTPEHEKVMKDIGKNWGVNISEGLAKKIGDDSKRLNDRTAAELLHLSEIIGEAGGVTVTNVDKWTKKAVEMMDKVAAGKIPVAEGIKQLNTLFPMLSATIEKTGGLASDVMLDLIDKAKATGEEVASITKFLQEQAASVASGFAGVAAGFNAAFFKVVGPAEDAKEKTEKLNKELELVQSQITELESKELLTSEQSAALELYKKKLEHVTQSIKDLGDQVVYNGRTAEEIQVNEQARFERLGRIAILAYESAIGSGMSFNEALDTIGGGLDELIKAQETFHFTSNDAFNDLLAIREFTTKNVELTAAVGGLNEMMKGLHNTGRLNQAGFTDLASEAAITMQSIRDGGLTSNQALQLMQPTLQTLWELEQRHGFAIDENTARILREAEASGTVGNQYVSAQDRMVTATEKVATVLEQMALKMGIAIGGVTAAIDGSSASMDQLQKNAAEREAWLQFQQLAQNASNSAANALGNVAGAIDDVHNGFGDALDAVNDFSEEARRKLDSVQTAVDGISYGSSPGGMKEWVPLIRGAMFSYRDFGRTAVGQLRDVRNMVDELGAPAMSYDVAGKVRGSDGMPAIPVANPGNVIHLKQEFHALDSSEAEQIMERRGLPAIINVLRRGEHVTELKRVIE